MNPTSPTLMMTTLMILSSTQAQDTPAPPSLDLEGDPDLKELASEIHNATAALKDKPFEDVDVLEADSGDGVDEEISDQGGISTTTVATTTLATTTSKMIVPKKKRCNCENFSCLCCLRPRIFTFKFNVCLGMTAMKETKVIQFSLVIARLNLTINIPTNERSNLCAPLPLFLRIFSICLVTTWDESSSDGSITSCTSIRVSILNAVFATMNFFCLKWTNDSLSFAPMDKKMIKDSLKLKIKRPCAKLISVVKQLKKKHETKGKNITQNN